jgi:two-component system phosphate regulon response regulator PhoB
MWIEYVRRVKSEPLYSEDGEPNGQPEFVQRRLILLGFEEDEAIDLSELLTKTLGVSAPAVMFGPAVGAEIPAGAGLVIIRLRPGVPVTRWLVRAAELAAKSIVLGAIEDFEARRSELAPATDILLLPWRPEEVTLRVARLIGRLSPSDRRVPVTKAKPRILLVDDDQNLLNLVHELCGNLHVDVKTAVEGIEALALAKQWRPSLIVLDVNMPHMSGIEVLMRLRADPDLRETPVLLLTACDESETISRAAELGATDYLMKPFSPFEVTRRIKRLLVA